MVSQGWDEVGTHLRDVFEQWAEYRIAVERLTALDDSHVLMEGRQHGLGRRSGIVTEDELYIVFRFGEERVTHMYWHPVRAGALEAAGLPA